MTGILWGLVGAICIGASDCIARVTTRQVSSTVLFLFIMGLSTAALSIWLLFNASWPQWHLYGWLTSALSGVLNILALFFLYRALARGPVSVASPTASTFSVILILLNILSGEPWAWIQVLAGVVVFSGVIMLARPVQDKAIDVDYDAAWLRTTATYSLLCAVSIALRMFLAQESADALGAIHALYLNRVFALVTTLVVVGYLLLQSVQLQWPRGSLKRLVVLQTVLETCALGSFLIGSASGGRIGAAIGFSVFAAITAILARVWLGELVGLRRWFWIAVVAAGVLLAVLGTPDMTTST